MDLLYKNILMNSVQDANQNGIVLPTTPKQRYTQRFNQIIPCKNDLTFEQKEVLNELANSMKEVDLALSEFRKNNIEYTVGIAGGAIRDFLAGKANEIKDIDIFVCFITENYKFTKDVSIPFISDVVAHELTNKKYHLKQIYEDLLEKTPAPNLDGLNQRKAQEKIFEHHRSINQDAQKKVLVDVCSEVLKKSFSVGSTHYSLNGMADNYLNSAIYGDIKLKSPHLKYPVDFVITKHSCKTFMASFDFSICKVASVYSDYDEKAGLHKVFDETKEPWENLYDNLFITPTFLKDMCEKTLTLDASDFSREHINYFMEKHYKKLVKKFPDYQPKIIKASSDLAKDLENAAMAIRLDLLLKDKDSPMPKKLKV